MGTIVSPSSATSTGPNLTQAETSTAVSDATGVRPAAVAVNSTLGRLDTLVTASTPAATWTPAAVALGASTASTLLAANANRRYFVIENPLATALFVRFAAVNPTEVVGGYDILIPTGGKYISDRDEWEGEIRGICATAGSVGVAEAV